MMAFHSVSWRIHCSCVDDINLIEQALGYLSDIKSEISREKSKSYHGAPQVILEMKISNKKSAKTSFIKLGKEVLEEIVSNGLKSQIDDDKVLHIRLSLSAMVSGEYRLAKGPERKNAVKGRFKIESYPGQNPEEVVNQLIDEIILK
tara:strand:- start:17406 stop:17846 length:441 start_codon:yes stop_codon:yes gene_type:complete